MPPTDAPSAGRSTRPEWTCVAVLALAVVAFAIASLSGVRHSSGFVVVYDAWLQGGAYVTCAVVAAVLAARARVGRPLWALLAVSLALWAAAYVVTFAWVRWQDPPPYPSLADGLWLSSELALLVLLLFRGRYLLRRISLVLALDTLAAAMLTVGVAVTVLIDVLRAFDAPGATDAARLTTMAYPVLGIILVTLAVALIASTGLQAGRADLALFLGIAAFAAADVAFLVRVHHGLFHPGGSLQVVALAVTALLALVPLTADRPQPERSSEPGSRDIVAVTTFGTVVVAFFVYASFEPVPTVSALLMAAALMLTIVRSVITVVGDRSQAGAALRSANEELLRFQALVDTSRDFIAIAAMDGQVLYVNPAGREMVGIPRDQDLSHETIVDFLTEEGIKASLEVEQPAVVAHGRWEGESTLLDRRGGPPIPVAISSFLMHHPRTGEPFALATVQRDITDRLAGEKLVADLGRQRELLLARLVRAQEDERAQIAADVHDDSVQALAAVDLRLGLLRRRVAETDESDLVEQLDKVLEVVRGATARLRHLLFDLESPALTNGLADALTAAAEFVFEDTEIDWQVTGDAMVDLPTPQRISAYRIAMEALTNVRTHARASAVEINLERRGAGVQMTVSDDGVGMTGPIRHRPGHRGLASSRDRAAVVGGWLRAEGAPGEGTRVTVWLPEVGPVAGADLDEQDRAPQPD